MTPRTALIVFRFAAPGLFVGIDSVPDFFRTAVYLRADDRNRDQHEDEDKKFPHDHLPFLANNSRSSAAVLALPRPPPPPPRAPAVAPPRPPPAPPVPEAISRGVRPCLSFLSS